MRNVWLVDDDEEMTRAIGLMLKMLDYDQSTAEPTADETGRHHGGVWDLMLHEADAPAGFRMYQESDENGVANFAP